MDQNSGQREIHCNVKYNNLSSFNTSNVEDMMDILTACSSLKKGNIILNNKDDKIIKEIERYCK